MKVIDGQSKSQSMSDHQQPPKKRARMNELMSNAEMIARDYGIRFTFANGIDHFTKRRQEWIDSGKHIKKVKSNTQELHADYYPAACYLWDVVRKNIMSDSWKILYAFIEGSEYGFSKWLKQGRPDHFVCLVDEGRPYPVPRRHIYLWNEVVNKVFSNKQYFSAQLLLCDIIGIKHPFANAEEEDLVRLYPDQIVEWAPVMFLKGKATKLFDERILRIIDECAWVEHREKNAEAAYALLLCCKREYENKPRQFPCEYRPSLWECFQCKNIQSLVFSFMFKTYKFTAL